MFPNGIRLMHISLSFRTCVLKGFLDVLKEIKDILKTVLGCLNVRNV